MSCHVLGVDGERQQWGDWTDNDVYFRNGLLQGQGGVTYACGTSCLGFSGQSASFALSFLQIAGSSPLVCDQYGEIRCEDASCARLRTILCC